MPQIITDINPASALTRVVDALCANFGYQTTIDGSPNPETRNQFAKRMNAQWLKGQVILYETSLAANEARVTAQASAELLNIT